VRSADRLEQCRFASAEPPVSPRSLGAGDLVNRSGETVVGSHMKGTGGTIGDRCFWSITCILIEGPGGCA
jgi:hypothetical protein